MKPGDIVLITLDRRISERNGWIGMIIGRYEDYYNIHFGNEKGYYKSNSFEIL
jgi:hypothetical protein